MKYNLDYYTKKFKYFPKHLNLVVVGTTQAHFAFDFSGIEVKAANMALVYGGLKFHSCFLEKYRHRICNGAVILITVEYPIFVCSGQWTKPEMNVHYARVLLGHNPMLPVYRQLFYKLFPYHYVKYPLFESTISAEEKNRIRNRLRLYEIDSNIRELIKGWEKEIYPIKILDYNNSVQMREQKERIDKSISILESTIYYCREHGWNPVIVGLPYCRQLNDALPKKFIEDCFYSCISRLQENIEIPFLDYSTDDQFSSIQNYMDIWFLNELGRKKFTKRVLNDLKKLCLF